MVDRVVNVKVHRVKGHSMHSMYVNREAALKATRREDLTAYLQQYGRNIWFRYRINVKMKEGYSCANPSNESPNGTSRPYTGCDAPRLKRVAV